MKNIIPVFIISLSLQVLSAQNNTDNITNVPFDIFGPNIEEKAPVPTESCECVPYYLCSPNNSNITDGVGLINIKEQGDCPNYLDVCCNPADKMTAVMPTTRHTGDVDKLHSIFGNIDEKGPPVARPCECVPYYRCSANNTIIADVAALIRNRRELDDCPSYLDVCCTKSETIDVIEG